MKKMGSALLVSLVSSQGLFSADEIKVQNLDSRVAALEEKVNTIELSSAGAYMKNADFLQDVHVYGDFLYWYSQQSDLGVAVQAVRATDGTTDIPQKVEYPNFEWAPGFRVGVGFNSGLDNWLFGFDWLHIRSRARKSLSTDEITFDPGDELFLNTWSSGLAGESAEYANTISAKARADLNQIDITLSKTFMPSPHTGIKLIMGLLGSRFDTSLDLHATSLFDSDLYDEQDDQIHIAQDYKGAGINAGAGFQWLFNSNVMLFTEFGCGLLLGDFTVSSKQTLTDLVDDEQVNMNFRSDFFATQAVLRALLGIEVGIWFSKDTKHFSFMLGWESLYYPNHLKFIKLVDREAKGNYTDINGDVSFGGMTLRAEFDF